MFVILKVSKREYYFYAGTWVSDLNFFVGFLYSFLLKGEISIYVIALGNPSRKGASGSLSPSSLSLRPFTFGGPEKKKSFLFATPKKETRKKRRGKGLLSRVRKGLLPFFFSPFPLSSSSFTVPFLPPPLSAVLFRQPSIFSGAGGGG